MLSSKNTDDIILIEYYIITDIIDWIVQNLKLKLIINESILNLFQFLVNPINNISDDIIFN